MMLILFAVWLVVALVLMAVFGYHDPGGDNAQDNPITVVFVFWPFFAAIGLLVGPFVGAYLLGRWARNRSEK